MNRRRISGFVLGAFAMVALSGCGQKGPLILPEEKIEELKKKKKQKMGRYPQSGSTRNA